jgi:hypothetical protein
LRRRSFDGVRETRWLWRCAAGDRDPALVDIRKEPLMAATLRCCELRVLGLFILISYGSTLAVLVRPTSGSSLHWSARLLKARAVGISPGPDAVVPTGNDDHGDDGGFAGGRMMFRRQVRGSGRYSR